MMSSPQYEKVESEDAAGVHTGRIVPIYEKLGPLTGKALRRVLLRLAETVPADLPDPLPPDLRARLQVIPRAEALRRIHLPREDDDLRPNAARSPAHRRLIWRSSSSSSSGIPACGPGRTAQARRLAITDGARTRSSASCPSTDRRPEARVVGDCGRHESLHPITGWSGRRGLGQHDGRAARWWWRSRTATRRVHGPPILAALRPSLFARCPYSVGLFTSAVKGTPRRGSAGGRGADR